METIPGAADVRIPQVLDYPTLRVKVDRDKALQLGIIADRRHRAACSLRSARVSMSRPASGSTTKNGVSYSVAVQTPQHEVDSIQAIGRTPITGIAIRMTRSPREPQFLGNLSGVSHEVAGAGHQPLHGAARG